MSDADPLASPSPPAASGESAAPWYYAIGDQRRGPVELAELRQLLSSGELESDDLVWRAGMADWTPAMDVEGLVDATGSPPIDIDPDVPPSGPPPSLRAKEKLREASAAATATAVAWSQWLRQNVEARTWVLVGLLLTVFADGCDSLAAKNVERKAAIAAMEQAEWQTAYELELARRKEEIDQLDTRGGKRAALAELKDSLQDYRDSQEELREELRSGRWKNLADEAERADNQYAIGAYWRQWMMLLGLALLTVSAGAVSISDRTPDRWVAMLLLGIVLWRVI